MNGRLVKFGETTAFVCGPRQRGHGCYSCGKPAEFQCDAPVFRDNKRGTCDRWLCERCRRNIGPNADLCRPHHKHWEENGRQFKFGGNL